MCEEKVDKLYEEFRALMHKAKDMDLSPADFAFHVLAWTTHMVISCAPTKTEANSLIKDAIKFGKQEGNQP